jgi:hypothetical protein
VPTHRCNFATTLNLQLKQHIGKWPKLVQKLDILLLVDGQKVFSFMYRFFLHLWYAYRSIHSLPISQNRLSHSFERHTTERITAFEVWVIVYLDLNEKQMVRTGIKLLKQFYKASSMTDKIHIIHKSNTKHISNNNYIHLIDLNKSHYTKLQFSNSFCRPPRSEPSKTVFHAPLNGFVQTQGEQGHYRQRRQSWTPPFEAINFDTHLSRQFNGMV